MSAARTRLYEFEATRDESGNDNQPVADLPATGTE